MLGKRYKISLAKYNQFGKKVKTDQIVLSIGTLPAANPRFAVVVPTKFCKKAVNRNKTKRLVWQSLDLVKEKVKPGIYKILVRGDFSELNFAQVLQKIESGFTKAGLFK